MRKLVDIIMVLSITCLFGFSLASCGEQAPEKRILGEWNTADRENEWIFYENGNMIGGDSDDREGGRWYMDDSTLSIESTYETVVFNYLFDDRKLRLYDNDELIGTLYKVTDDAVDDAINFKYSTDLNDGLISHLEESEAFIQTLSRFDNLVSSELVGIDGCINDNNDVGIYYTFKCSVPFKYMTREDYYSVSFAYSPFADDFYYDGGASFTSEQEYIWDEDGVASEIGIEYFSDLYPDDNVVECNLVDISTEGERARLTYSICIQNDYEYAIEYTTYEVSITYNANSSECYAGSNRDWMERTYDWSAIYGTWTYSDESRAFSITINSVDEYSDTINFSWDYNGITGADAYELDGDYGGGFYVSDIYEDRNSDITIWINPSRGVSCKLVSSFFSSSHDMNKMY